jgi:hypothetical protein
LTITTYPSGDQIAGNYANLYLGNYQAAANPPTSNPTANTFRIYLPTDSGTTPVKPYLEQFLSYFSGPNPLTTNQTSVYTVTVRMTNPTSSAITFSSSNLITANIPGSGATYAGSPTVTQGSVVSQPSINSTGNITWNPGTLAAGATANLTYRVNLTPTVNGQRVVATGTPALNGTRAIYVDETGNTTQARSTYTFGPICELAATEGNLAPTAVEDVMPTAKAYDNGVYIEWETGFEVDNLGFNIYREENGERTKINPQMVAGSALLAGPGTPVTSGAQYSWWDNFSGDKLGVQYWVEDIDLNGTTTLHGPFRATWEGGRPAPASQAELLSQLGVEDYTPQSQFDQADEALPRSISSSSKSTGMAVMAAASGKAPEKGKTPEVEPAGMNAVKLMISEEGWYRVSIADLVAAGFSDKFSAENLQIFVAGKEVPLLVSGVSGKSAEGGMIEFYATGQDTPSTGARTYWVIAGSAPGQRISILNAPGDGTPSGSFPYTLQSKERTTYFAALKNEDQENFFGRSVTTTETSQQLTLKNVDASFQGTAKIEVSLQGVTNLAGTTDHQVRVKINGIDLGRVVFDGTTKGLETFTVPHNTLREGTNTVSFVAEGGSLDVSLVDYVRVTYQHTYAADDDSLKFSVSASTSRTSAVGNFSSPLIRVIDITNSGTPVELAGKVSEASGKYSVSIETPDLQPRTLLMLTADRIKRPASISLNKPSSLKSANNQADLLIITHRSVMGGASALQALRSTRGFAASVIDVEDIYDEFNFGDKSPKTIKDFLSTAKTTWKKPPRFVLFFGDASFDPRNYLGKGDSDLVPTKLIETTHTETASDDWFVDFNQDGIADIPIGRLPVRTAEGADKLVAKMTIYERTSRTPESRSALLVADRNDGFNFEGYTNQASGLLGSTVSVQRVFRSRTDDASAKSAIINALNSGSLIVNYAGHGSTSMWRGSLLTADAVSQIRNSNALPMFVTMTCLNGYFIDPTFESLAEVLVESPEGGAIAAWASSGLSDPQQQATVNLELYRQLFGAKGSAITIGEAVIKAKAATASLDVRKSWILFGDPTVRLK